MLQSGVNFRITNSRISSLLFCMALIISGCGGRDYEGAQRIELSGTVTLDNEPVDGGTISFIPTNSKQRVSGGDIIKGKYQVAEAKGANVGAYRVEIYFYKPTGKMIDDSDTGTKINEMKQVIPPQYNAQSTLTAEVSASAKTFDFQLTSK